MSASPNEYLHPWERATEQQYHVDFLFRTEVQSIIDSCPIGDDYDGWAHVYRVMLALRDERGLTSVFGRRYRKRMQIMPGGGGRDLPVWWFDVAGRVPESYGYDPPVIVYKPSAWEQVGDGVYQITGWTSENIIEQ